MSRKRSLLILTVLAVLAFAVIPSRTNAVGIPSGEPAPVELNLPALSAPVTTGFTYQGQLKLNDSPVDTTCNIAFALFDAVTGGTQVGSTLNQSISVTKGFFTTQLDFGAVFQGDTRWLEITPNCGAGAVTLTPRQPLTAVPYALFSAAPWVTSGTNLSYSAGNVGIGTTSPDANLEIVSPSTAEIKATAHNSVAQFIGQSAGGTIGAETAVTTDTELAWFGARGYDGTEFTASRAAMIMNASENWTNAAHGTDIAFGTTPNGTTSRTEKMRITEAGNVGIGTKNPSADLEVVNLSTAAIKATAHNSVAQFIGQRANGAPGAETAVGAGAELAWFGARGYDGTDFTNTRAAIIMTASENWSNAAHGTDITFGTTANGTTSRTEKMRITEAGSVGIGTTPTRAKVEINGFGGSYPNVPPAGFLNETTPTGVTGGGFTISSFSLYASNDIGASVYFAFSDERIKHIEGRSDGAQDLTTLASIEVTDYTYIDTVGKGEGKQKKLLGQQVEKVYPQAVSRSTDVVPDIYQKAEVKDGWVKLAADLQVGERVRLIGAEQAGIYEVLEVVEDKFRTDFVADGDAVFVYGREVKDFRNVDYESIAMLNVSATQELNRLVQQQAAEIDVLKFENEALNVRLATLEQKVNSASNDPLTPWLLFGGLGVMGLAVVQQRRTGG